MPVPAASDLPDGEFVWLAEVRRDGHFMGYRRLETTYDSSTNMLYAAMSMSELDDTLLLPAVLVPTFVHTTDPTAHLWSSPFVDAADFGPLSEAGATLQVVGPRIAGRLYVYDPTLGTYGWIDADVLGPLELLATL